MASNVFAIVAQVIEALQESRSQTIPPRADMPRDLLATTEILGQDPGLRRPLGSAGNAVFGAWTQTAAATERVTVLRGNGQVALAGTAVRVSPTIAITDGFGRPRQGVSVGWAVTVGAGSVVGAASNTDQNGVASVTAWTLGATPGLNQLQATVKVKGVPPADVVAVAAPTRLCEVLDGNGQQGRSRKALPIEPAVRVVDVTGQPLVGLNVAFTVSAGGNIVNTAQVTDQNGIATPGVWTLGATGTNTLVAEVVGADAAVLTAQAI